MDESKILERISHIKLAADNKDNIALSQNLIGKDLLDIYLSIHTLIQESGGGVIIYEEITLIDYQNRSGAGTLDAGKIYAITDITSGVASCIVLVGAYISNSNNAVVNGTLIYPSYPTDKCGIWDIQLDVVAGEIIYFYNRAYDVKCNTDDVLVAIFTYLSQGLYEVCNFINYIGTLTVDNSGHTRLKNCDFSNSDADFDTINLDTPATFSGRILHDFVVPDQSQTPCDFADTVFINADGTNNLQARIVLAASQTTLDCTNFQSASIIRLIPDAGGNSIDEIIGCVAGREYKITSNDTMGYLQIGTGNNIFINDVSNLFYSGLIQWNTSNSNLNEMYFIFNGTNALITAKTNTYQ